MDAIDILERLMIYPGAKPGYLYSPGEAVRRHTNEHEKEILKNLKSEELQNIRTDLATRLIVKSTKY